MRICRNGTEPDFAFVQIRFFLYTRAKDAAASQQSLSYTRAEDFRNLTEKY